MRTGLLPGPRVLGGLEWTCRRRDKNSFFDRGMSARLNSICTAREPRLLPSPFVAARQKRETRVNQWMMNDSKWVINGQYTGTSIGRADSLCHWLRTSINFFNPRARSKVDGDFVTCGFHIGEIPIVCVFAEHSARNARNAGAVWAPGTGWGGLRIESITWHVSPVTPAPVNSPRVSNSRFWTPDCSARLIIWMWSRVTILRRRRIAIPSTAAKAARPNA